MKIKILTLAVAFTIILSSFGHSVSVTTTSSDEISFNNYGQLGTRNTRTFL
ncbi:MAG: hypothetical protein MJY64_01115 [archaeon]|nr:hypothetical protein [archaeon]